MEISRSHWKEKLASDSEFSEAGGGLGLFSAKTSHQAMNFFLKGERFDTDSGVGISGLFPKVQKL